MNKLKDLRVERGYSTRGLEIKTGINHSTIARYENESRDFSTDVLKQLAKFFEVSIDYLLCFTPYNIYINDKESNTIFKMDEYMLDKLKGMDAVYYEYDHRYVDFSKVFGGEIHNVGYLMVELNKINNMDKLFEKGTATMDEVNEAMNQDTPIELNMKLINEVKKALDIK